MNKKMNLVLATFLLGEVTTVLPSLLKLCVFTGIAVLLFMKYDEWEYDQRVGGKK